MSWKDKAIQNDKMFTCQSNRKQEVQITDTKHYIACLIIKFFYSLFNSIINYFDKIFIWNWEVLYWNDYSRRMSVINYEKMIWFNINHTPE